MEYISVTAAVIEKDGKFLIARRMKPPFLAGKWEFPGGKIESGEKPEACLKREIFEEFGAEVSVGRLILEWEHDYKLPDGRRHKFFSYLCEWQSGEFVPSVHDAIAWVGSEEFAGYDIAPADVALVREVRNSKFMI